MKAIISGQTITCQGQELMLVVDYVSGSVDVSVLTLAGSPVLLESITSATKPLRLPGYAGTRYTVSFSAGTVEVHGGCTVS